MKQRIILPPTRTEKFLELYLKTGNATEAAWQTFNCSSRASAQAMGSYYLKKSKDLAFMVMEQKEITLGRLIDIAWEKCQKNKKPDFWDRLMKIGGYDTYNQ